MLTSLRCWSDMRSPCCLHFHSRRIQHMGGLVPAHTFPPRLALAFRSGQRLAGRQARTVASASAETTVTQLPPALEKIVTLFKLVPDPKLKYQQLLAYAKNLPVLPPELHADEHKVRGCVSQVWVVAALDDDGNLDWKADSDSALTKGLAALLVLGLNGSPPEAVVKMNPDWISQMGLQQSLTPSRNNGFFNMFKLMQQKSLELLIAQDRAAQAAQSGTGNPTAGASEPLAADQPVQEPAPVQQSNIAGDMDVQPSVSSNGHASTSASAASASPTPVRDSMDTKLRAALQPISLAIIDESAQHAGHAAMRHGHAGAGGETHFRVHVTSPAFEGLKTMQRHRLIYQALREELAGPVHALSLVTRSPAEADP